MDDKHYSDQWFEINYCFFPVILRVEGVKQIICVFDISIPVYSIHLPFTMTIKFITSFI